MMTRHLVIPIVVALFFSLSCYLCTIGLGSKEFVRAATSCRYFLTISHCHCKIDGSLYHHRPITCMDVRWKNWASFEQYGGQ